MLQQTFSLLLNVSFPPCFLTPLLLLLLLLLSLSLSLSLFFFFRGGVRRERPRLNPRLLGTWKSNQFNYQTICTNLYL